MKQGIWLPFFLLFAWIAVADGCDGGDEGDEQLVRYAIEGELDFDTGDGPEHVFTLDESIVINADGEGSRSGVAIDASVPFDVPAHESEQLEAELDDLDFDYLRDHYGFREGDEIRTTLVYDGESVELGDRASEINGGEGPEQAQRLFRIEELIATAATPTTPEEIEQAGEHVRGESNQLFPGLGQASRRNRNVSRDEARACLTISRRQGKRAADECLARARRSRD